MVYDFSKGSRKKDRSPITRLGPKIMKVQVEKTSVEARSISPMPTKSRRPQRPGQEEEVDDVDINCPTSGNSSALRQLREITFILP